MNYLANVILKPGNFRIKKIISKKKLKFFEIKIDEGRSYCEHNPKLRKERPIQYLTHRRRSNHPSLTSIEIKKLIFFK